MCWQHFAMGKYVDTFAFGLLQDFFQIMQVVTRHQDRFTSYRFHVHFSWLWMTESFSFTFIQHRHNFEVHLADLHRTIDQWLHFSWFSTQEGHDLVIFRTNSIILLTQHTCMFHVSGSTFQAIQTQQAQTQNVFADLFMVTIHRCIWCPGQQFGFVGSQDQRRRASCHFRCFTS